MIGEWVPDETEQAPEESVPLPLPDSRIDRSDGQAEGLQRAVVASVAPRPPTCLTHSGRRVSGVGLWAGAHTQHTCCYTCTSRRKSLSSAPFIAAGY